MTRTFQNVIISKIASKLTLESRKDNHFWKFIQRLNSQKSLSPWRPSIKFEAIIRMITIWNVLVTPKPFVALNRGFLWRFTWRHSGMQVRVETPQPTRWRSCAMGNGRPTPLLVLWSGVDRHRDLPVRILVYLTADSGRRQLFQQQIKLFLILADLCESK